MKSEIENSIELDLMTTKKLVSIICPVFNEEKAIPLFYARATNAILDISGDYDFEFIFTNNRSIDDSLEVIENIRRKNNQVQVITLSRNFGYQASVMAGLIHANGDAMIIIDADCEDPPEMIPRFIRKWEDGFDVAYGLRLNRPESRILVFARKLFYRVLKLFADSNIILDMAEFSLVTKRVKDVMIANKSSYPFLRAEIGYAGFNQIGIPYDRQLRVSGKSKYNFWGMFIFAAGGILSTSTFPLRVAVYLLPFIAILNIMPLFFNNDYFNIVIGRLNIIYIIYLISFQGLYIARIYKNNMSRPIYIIDWSLTYLNKI